MLPPLTRMYFSSGLPRAAEIIGDIYICTPCSIADNMRKVGGVTAVLAMVEAAESREMLHFALSLLQCVLKYNARNARDMQKCHGYHLLGLFLHHRISFFDRHCLELLFQITICQGAGSVKVLPVSEKPSYLQKTLSLQEPVRQISGVPEAVSKLVSMNSDLDSGFDVSSNPSKFDDQGSSYGSIVDTVDSFGQDSSIGAGVSDLGVDTNVEDIDCVLLANPEMMEHVLLDWTLWVIAPISIQLAIVGFIGRLVAEQRYHKHNMTILRRLNTMQHLLVTLQRGDVETEVLEAVVDVVALMLKDGFLSAELQLVADFVLMTFDPTSFTEGNFTMTSQLPSSVRALSTIA
jgi:hypothetical protein